MKIFKNDITIDVINNLLSKMWEVEILRYAQNDIETYNNVAELSEANQKSICFFENEKYLDDLKISKAGLILIPTNFDISSIPTNENTPIFLKIQKPYLAFMTLVTYLLEQENKNQKRYISKLASVHPSAKIGENVQISDFAVIEEDASIDDNAVIGFHSVIGKDCQIGKGCKIYPNVVIYENCKVGNKVIIHSGSVIGADGFGYLPIEGYQVKIPQVGNVVIEDDVEIGANTCIDRATIGTTIIKSNAKIDNLVQVAHNCSIDSHSILCSQVGLAGNSHIGKSVYLAGQVGVAGHLKIEDNSMVGAQSGVANSLGSGKYFGSPAISAYEQKKISASLKDLPVIMRYVKKLMKKES